MSTSTTGFAPQVVVSYHPASDLTFYAQASEGYRAGGFNRLDLPAQTSSEGASGSEFQLRYAGDELWDYEAGGKISLAGGSTRIRAAVFDMVWKDVQSIQLMPNGLSYVANIGNGHDLGIEADALLTPGPRWRVTFNAVAAEPELASPNLALRQVPDNSLPGAAHLTAGASAQYALPLANGRLMRFNLGGDYVGGSSLTLDAGSARPMGDYAVGRASVEYVDRHWSLTLFARGPLSTGADAFAYGNPFSYRTVPQVTPVRPLTVGMALSLQTP